MFGHRRHPGHHGHPRHRGRSMQQRMWRRPKHNIPVNIIENETEFECHVHCVTFPKESVKVSIVGDMIYISGTREPEDLHPNFLLQEYPIKSFERSFELSHTVDKANVSARHESGVLIITAPKLHVDADPGTEIRIA